MFNLSEAHYNIVKKCARRCAKEVKDLIQEGKKYDEVAAKVIDKHHEAIKVLITRLQFIWLIGYLEGRLGNKRSGDYE